MPPSVSVTYNAKYNEEEIGRMAETANAALQAFSNTDGNVGQKTAAAGGQLAGGAASGLLGMGLDKLSPQGTKEMLEINAGAVMTPRMELLFDGIGRRNFSYNFMFIPKSKKNQRLLKKLYINLNIIWHLIMADYLFWVLGWVVLMALEV